MTLLNLVKIFYLTLFFLKNDSFFHVGQGKVGEWLSQSLVSLSVPFTMSGIYKFYPKNQPISVDLYISEI